MKNKVYEIEIYESFFCVPHEEFIHECGLCDDLANEIVVGYYRSVETFENYFTRKLNDHSILYSKSNVKNYTLRAFGVSLFMQRFKKFCKEYPEYKAAFLPVMWTWARLRGYEEIAEMWDIEKIVK